VLLEAVELNAETSVSACQVARSLDRTDARSAVNIGADARTIRRGQSAVSRRGSWARRRLACAESLVPPGSPIGTTAGAGHTESMSRFSGFSLRGIAFLVAGVLGASAGGAKAAPPVTAPGFEHANLYGVDLADARPHRLTNAADEVLYLSPDFSPNGRTLVFERSSTDDGIQQLYVMAADGGPMRKLKTAVTHTLVPQWSPDGRRLLFIGGRGSVYVMNHDGTHLRRLIGPARAHDKAVWSPNGRQIAYTTQQANGRWDIWVMDADGKYPHALTRTSGAEEYPSWSPDGRSIAFAKQVSGRWALYVMANDGSHVRPLIKSKFSDEMPAWSPNGRQIAFTRLKGHTSSVYVMNRDGTHLRLISGKLRFSYAASWSPDGRRLVFSNSR
jgi:Tol biopolymer transport system component